ncbi:phosphopyruvate hydratase [Thermasporomyces composti]|uniref:Enolase n=1 Tax=Thermasporomyces composti TaxID=696763 RepID=A0A3D9V977_THECX|nr:phosphopyruvate hydratase [Thermasporomyces composti]REF37846.1 enolase [Thermasporomyces composti]
MASATSTSQISGVFAWEALDSRGRPTVGCEVTLRSGARGEVVVPSGASTGTYEVHERRDGGEPYGGFGVRQAVRAVVDVLAPAVHGLDAHEQETVDAALVDADGTANLSRLGGNAVLAVSLATLLAAADDAGLPLYRYLDDSGLPPLLPLPMVNIVSGGAHAGRLLDIQDVLAVPVGATETAQAIEWVWRVRTATGELLEQQGEQASLVADEGGLAAHLPTNAAALDLVTRAIERAGLRPGTDVALAVDLAASQFALPNGRYRLAIEDREVSRDEWLDEVTRWCHEFPVVSLEDVLSEDDWAGWVELTRRLPHVQLLGDDLFATHLSRLDEGIGRGAGNAILVKPNQTGTVSRAQRVVQRALESGYACVVSARSGDTEDSYLADLAIGWRAGQIKVGSLTRSERTAKWNRLLRIAAELGDRATFASRQALGGRRP